MKGIKNRARRWLVCVFVVAMVFAPLPRAAFAEEVVQQEAAVGEIQYTTLGEAIAVANGEEIQLLKDIEVSKPIAITSNTVINGANGEGAFTITASGTGHNREGLFHLNSETDASSSLTLKNISLINKVWSNSSGVSVRASNQTVNLDNVTIDTGHYCVFVGVPGEENEDTNDVTVNIDNSRLTGYAAIYYRTNSITNMIMRPVLKATNSELTGRGVEGHGNGFSTIVYNGTRDARATISGCTLSNSFDAINADVNEGIIQFNCFGAYEEGAEITISHSKIKTRSTTAAPNVIKYTAAENLNVGNKVIIDDLTLLVDEDESDLIRLVRNGNELVATGKELSQVLSLDVPIYNDKPTRNTESSSLLADGDIVQVSMNTVLAESVTIPRGVTVLISEDAKLTIPEGMTFKGEEGAYLVVQGTIQGLEGATGDGSFTWGEDGTLAVLATGVDLDKDELTLQKNGTAQLEAKVMPENATNKDVIWTSSDENIATVDANGKITAVACGTATITVTVDGTDLMDSCDVTVAHALTKINEKPATCLAEGYTGDKACKECGTVIENGDVIEKLAHSYIDGTCTVCGTADPSYKPITPNNPGQTDNPTDSGEGNEVGTQPATGDETKLGLYTLLGVIAFLLVGVQLRLKKDSQ